MIEQLQNLLGDCKILFVCRTGSRLFCQNCHDDDLLVVVDDWDCDSSYFRLENCCVFCYSLKEFEKFAQLKLNDYRNVYSLCLLFAKGDNVIYGTNPLPEYNWWDHQDKALCELLKTGARSFFNPKITNGTNPTACIKNTVWALATYFAVLNQSTEFTAEQKNMLQLCHDNGLPIGYRDELRNNLLLLNAQRF